MYLGLPADRGLPQLLDTYPDGGDLAVSINDDNGNLIGLWIWQLDTANSDCEGADGDVLSGWFVTDVTDTLPLTITAGAGPRRLAVHRPAGGETLAVPGLARRLAGATVPGFSA